MGNNNCNIYYEELLKNPKLCIGSTTVGFGTTTHTIECMSCSRPIGEHKRSTCVCQKCQESVPVAPPPTK